MSINIHRFFNGDYAACRLDGTPVSWWGGEQVAGTLGGMWNATAGQVNHTRHAVMVGGVEMGRDAYIANFKDGYRAAMPAVVSSGFEIQSSSALYDRIAQVNEFYPCDFMALYTDGQAFSASFNIGHFETADKSKHFSRFMLLVRYDKTGSDVMNLSTIRVVCSNTCMAALRTGSNKSIRHTREIDLTVKNTLDAYTARGIQSALDAQGDYIETYNRLLELPAPPRDEVYNAIFPQNDEGKRNMREGLIDSFEAAYEQTVKQSPELRGTAAALFNAATHWKKTARTRVGKGESATAANFATQMQAEHPAVLAMLALLANKREMQLKQFGLDQTRL